MKTFGSTTSVDVKVTCDHTNSRNWERTENSCTRSTPISSHFNAMWVCLRLQLRSHFLNRTLFAGPGKWNQLFADKCGEGMQRQSPINIQGKATTYNDQLSDVTVHDPPGFDTDKHMYLYNNGHSGERPAQGRLLKVQWF